MSVTAAERSPSNHCKGFLPIAVDTLSPTSVLEFDLYIRPSDKKPPLIYRERSYPLNQRDLKRLARTGVDLLYVTVASHMAYETYLRETLTRNEHLTLAQRYKILRTATRTVFETAFCQGNLNLMVEVAGDFGQHMTKIILGRDMVLTDLIALMDHDYYTYTHVTNVSVYCLAMAKGLGISRKTDLLAIATGALLHDFGKRHVPPAVLNYPGRFNDEQRALVEQHPADGFRELCLREDLSWAQLMMVYQHHERLNGRGYPVGLGGDEIDQWAKMCMIADVFDALSSDRPYRKADPIGKVLDFLEHRTGTDFDKEMVLCLKSMIK